MYDGGIKPIGLHLRATCKKRSVAHFRDAIILCFATYHVYRRSSPPIRIYIFAFGKHNEIQVGLLDDNV